MLYGHMAVSVFIVVSGFSLAIAPTRVAGTSRVGVAPFRRRRAWRILPAYWAALILSILVLGWRLRRGAGPLEVGKAFAVHGLMLQDVVDSAYAQRRILVHRHRMADLLPVPAILVGQDRRGASRPRSSLHGRRRF